jgi:protein-ribulosamine 3-kinase
VSSSPSRRAVPPVEQSLPSSSPSRRAVPPVEQSRSFLLQEFIHTSDTRPDPAQLGSNLAELHRKSRSPEGSFGFHTRNYQGGVPQIIDWDPSWSSFFSRLIADLFSAECILNGPWPSYESAFKKLLQHVIPQLLEPLQSDGRSIKPCLVHGNLSVANTPTNLASGSPVFFDTAAFYAHHEYELGMWRRATVNFDDKYFWQYFKHYPPSEPIKAWEDRVRLYSIKFNLVYMISCPGSLVVRKQYVLYQLRPMIVALANNA